MFKRIKISNVNALQFFQLVRYAVLLLIGILFSKSGLSQTEIGHYETFMLIAGAFTLFWVTGFLKVLLPMWTEKPEHERPRLVFNIFVLLLFFSLVASVLVLLINKPFSNILLNGNHVPMPVVLALYILINSPSLMTEYVYLINKKSGHIVVYAIIIFTIQLVAVGLPALLGYGLSQILLSLLGVSLIRFIWLLFVLKKYAAFSFDFALIKQFAIYGSPLVASTLLSSSARYIDGFIITSHFSPDDFAVFQYGARELPLSLLLCNSLSMSMLPALARKNIASPLAEFRSEIYRLILLLFPVSIVLMLTSHWFYPIVFNEQFEASASIFNVYLLLVISRVLFPQTILMGKKMNRHIVWASLFEVIINVSLSIVLARTVGLIGVAYATIVAYVFEKIYLMIVCKKKTGIVPQEYLPVNMFLTFSVLLLAAFILVEFIV